jgi:hypothetical protein
MEMLFVMIIWTEEFLLGEKGFGGTDDKSG